MQLNQLSELFYALFWIFVYSIILFVFLSLVLYFVARRKRKKIEASEQYGLTFLQIKVPPQNEIEISAAEQFFSSLFSFRRSRWDNFWKGKYRISFEIVSTSDGIGFYVVVPDELALAVEKQINGAYPVAEIDIIDPNEVWDRGDFTAIAELKLSGAPYFPIKTHEDLSSDALSSITSSLSKLGENDVLALQYIIQPSSDSWRNQGRRFVDNVRGKSSDPEKNIKIDTSFVEGVEKKIAKSGFDVSIRVVSIAQDKNIADTHIQNVVTSFEQFTDVKYNNFKEVRPSEKKLIDNFIYRRLKVADIYIPLFDVSLYRNTSVLNIEEMASVFHFPNKNIQTPNIIWLTSRRSAPPTNVPTSGLYLGRNIFRGMQKDIYMLEKDRTRHLYIVGQTGTGKSEFMKSLAVQDIKNGEGLAFIDPHGSDIQDLLQKIPKERMHDVVLFDASDYERPLGLNILEASTEEQKNMIINAFIALLYKLYDPNRQGMMGPQLERTIRNVMLTAMVDPNSTMVDVLRLLIDKDYVQTFLPKVQDPLVRRYWTDEIAKTSEFHKSEKMGYFVSKFDRFVTERTMRNVLGQPKSAINFSEIMANKKILLVDLSKGKIGEENSNFLGLILVPKILMAALARTSIMEKGVDFPNFYLYVDEFQNFATPDFATILSEARKYKLNLIVGHQFVAQLSDEIKEAIFGNVGTIACFRVGPDDAEYLENQFEPVFSQSDLINLPVGDCYMRILIDGQPSVPFSMNVNWDMINATPKDPSIAEAVRNHSRQTYGASAQEVEAFINKRVGLEETEQKLVFSKEKKRIPF